MPRYKSKGAVFGHSGIKRVAQEAQRVGVASVVVTDNGIGFGVGG
jgi:hypothetical protein